MKLFNINKRCFILSIKLCTIYRLNNINKFNSTILPYTSLNNRLHALIYIIHNDVIHKLLSKGVLIIKDNNVKCSVLFLIHTIHKTSFL